MKFSRDTWKAYYAGVSCQISKGVVDIFLNVLNFQGCPPYSIFLINMCRPGFQNKDLQNGFFGLKLGTLEPIFVRIGVLVAEI